jgi:hypothetical protein
LKKCFDVVGLIFNMVGVGILFIWGPPQPSFEGGGGLLLEDPTVGLSLNTERMQPRDK